MRPILSLVVDRSVLRRPLAQSVESAVRAGVDWVQIRDRELETLALLEHAREVAEAAGAAARACGREVLVFVNRRIDVAMAIAADGVHLGGDALCVAEARALLGEQARIGVSTHSPEEVGVAAGQGADYVHLAPIFAPRSKAPQRPPLTPGSLAAASGHAVPVIAQGGIDDRNCARALAAGAAGVAVTGAILMSDDPGAAAARLRAALDAG